MTITESAVLEMESDADDKETDTDSRRRRGVFARVTGRVRSVVDGVGEWSSKHGRVVLVALSLLVIGLVTAATVLGIRVHSDSVVDDAKSNALAAANDNVPKLLSYRFDTVDADLGAASQFLVGDFADEFNTLATQTIIPSAKQAGTVTAATVAASSLVAASADSVTVLLFLNQSTTSIESPSPKLDSSRVRVELEPAGDQWLITSLEPV